LTGFGRRSGSSSSAMASPSSSSCHGILFELVCHGLPLELPLSTAPSCLHGRDLAKGGPAQWAGALLRAHCCVLERVVAARRRYSGPGGWKAGGIECHL
jgi:hypothetical protein